MLCPRCGKNELDEREVFNPLSRYRRAYICQECGDDETINGNKKEWATDDYMEHWDD